MEIGKDYWIILLIFFQALFYRPNFLFNMFKRLEKDMIADEFNQLLLVIISLSGLLDSLFKITTSFLSLLLI